uniref:Ground-like domain-containing protein n=1 Tax=Bursaphelenchus xylophilus TaxID=6326 RepID=A0A1I7SMJ9_BURXY
MSVPVLVSVILLLCFVEIAEAEDTYQSSGSLPKASKPIIFDKRSSEKIQTRQRRQGYVILEQNDLDAYQDDNPGLGELIPPSPAFRFHPPKESLQDLPRDIIEDLNELIREIPSKTQNSSLNMTLTNASNNDLIKLTNDTMPGCENTNAQSQSFGRSQQLPHPPSPGPFPFPSPNSAPLHPKPYPRQPPFITQPVQQRQFNMRTRPLNWPAYKTSNVQNNSASRTYVGDANKAGVIGGVPPEGAQRPAPPPESEAHPYYFPPRMQLPLPSCFHNPTGYACCNAQLNDLMVETYTELEAKPKFHICNINAIANQIQKKAEEKFNTTFETIASFEDFAQKIHFHTDLVCKVELGGKFMLAYGTVKNVADKLPPATEPANVVKRAVFGPEPELEIPPRPIYHSILI